MRVSEGFGAQIKRARVKKRHKQKDLAALIGCSQSRISAWEGTPARPSPEFWEPLAEYVDVDVEVVREWAERESGPRPGDWEPPPPIPQERPLAEIAKQVEELQGTLQVIRQSLDALDEEVARRRLEEQLSAHLAERAIPPIR